MTEVQQKLFDRLCSMRREARPQGFAIVVFTPDEMGSTDIKVLERALIEKGWSKIREANGEAPLAPS